MERKIKVGMEEITQAAEATYKKLPEEEKKEIEKMFKLIDQDGDGKVSVQEFKTYLKRKGDHAKVNSNLFNLIDRNEDGNLQFDEVFTLFYITESGRPVCDGCGNFIQGLFFTCTECHYSKPAEDGYNICIACYKPGGFGHDHTEFLDNYTLFVEMKKNGAGSARTQTNSPDQSSRGGMPPPRIRKRDKFKRPFKALKEMIGGVVTAATLYAMVDEFQEEPDAVEDKTEDQ